MIVVEDNCQLFPGSETLTQRLLRDAQQLGGSRLVAAGPAQGFLDQEISRLLQSRHMRSKAEKSVIAG